MTRRKVMQAAALGLAAALRPASVRDARRERPLLLFLARRGHAFNSLAVESARGFRAALGTRLAAGGHEPAIYPGLGDLTAAQSHDLLDRVRRGQWALIEGGVNFAAEREAMAHRDRMRELFGLRLEKTVIPGKRSGHYVSYRWPLDRTFRHFGAIIPVIAEEHEVIARAGELSAAVKRRVGNGGIVYLGTPLGPILMGEDRDARQLAHALADRLAGI